MTDGRRLVALLLLAFAVGASILGTVRGLADAGPGSGFRIVATIAPPVTDAAREMVEHNVQHVLDNLGIPTRRVVAGDRLVVELGTDDDVIAGELAARLQRTRKLELHAVDPDNAWLARVAAFAAADRESGGIRVVSGVPVAAKREVLAAYLADLAAREPALAAPPDRVIAYGRVDERTDERIRDTWRPYVLERASLVDPRTIVLAEITAGGVVVDTTVAPHLERGVPVAFVLDDVVEFVGRPDWVDATAFHVSTPGADEDAMIRAAIVLRAVVETGAAPPLHVVRQEAFSRATGFVPRAWPFLAVGVVLAIAALLVWPRLSGSAGTRGRRRGGADPASAR